MLFYLIFWKTPPTSNIQHPTSTHKNTRLLAFFFFTISLSMIWSNSIDGTLGPNSHWGLYPKVPFSICPSNIFSWPVHAIITPLSTHKSDSGKMGVMFKVEARSLMRLRMVLLLATPPQTTFGMRCYDHEWVQGRQTNRQTERLKNLPRGYCNVQSDSFVPIEWPTSMTWRCVWSLLAGKKHKYRSYPSDSTRLHSFESGVRLGIERLFWVHWMRNRSQCWWE